MLIILATASYSYRSLPALHPAASRYCSERRTMQPGSSSRLHDVFMPGHYCGAITALAAHSTQNRVQGRCVDFQEPQQRYSTDSRQARVSKRTLRSSTAPLLDKPFTRMDFANRAFRCSAPTVWNSLPETIITLTTDLPPAPLKLRPYGAIQIRLLLLLLEYCVCEFRVFLAMVIQYRQIFVQNRV